MFRTISENKGKQDSKRVLGLPLKSYKSNVRLGVLNGNNYIQQL